MTDPADAAQRARELQGPLKRWIDLIEARSVEDPGALREARRLLAVMADLLDAHMPDRRCGYCAGPMPPDRRGKYCRDAHKVAAWRQRQRSA